MFYINNYIDWDQFNQLYNSNQIEKGIKNTNAIIRKLELALTKITNHRLEVAREEKQKKEEIIKKQRTKAIVAKRQRIRKEISLSNEEEKNYESDIRDKTNPDQADDEYSLLN